MKDNPLPAAAIATDRRSVIINGKREFLISGEMHYPRSTPLMWPNILRESKRAGLNCISTYVFWEGHEPQEGYYDFTDRFNLRHFLDCCQAEGLYVILRIGPYVCGEWNFGGLPWWLITKTGLITRTYNKPFMRAVEHWMRVLLAEVGDRQITQGGPIILVQMENEYNNVSQRYNQAGQDYLAWMAAMSRQAGIEVPLIMCEGAPEDVIETINGFSVWDRVEKLQQKRFHQPALWTENWLGWYNVWCDAYRRRPIEDITYEIIRFLALGGSGINYYMWHGGTNFDRDVMYLQTTSYECDAAFDEYGLPTQKSVQLSLLNEFIRNFQQILLEGTRSQREVLVPNQSDHDRDGVFLHSVRYLDQEIIFVINALPQSQQVSAYSVTLNMPAHSAGVLLGTINGTYSTVYCTWDTPKTKVVREMIPTSINLFWEMIEEPLPGQGLDADRRFVEITLPHNMLFETMDKTDYGWYSTVVASPQAGLVKLTAWVADLLSVWVNGQYVGSAPASLKENRLSLNDFRVEIEIPLQAGENKLLLLVSAIGMIKGDWMINAPQSEERKGIIAPVAIDGVKVSGSWVFSAGLWGERVKIFNPSIASLAPWQTVINTSGPLRWYRATFMLDREQIVKESPWALEIGSLFKGMIWVNGHCIGRYWQQSSDSNTTFNLLNTPVLMEDVGKPPQHFYHIPAEWLYEGKNTIVIVEERGAVPGANTQICRIKSNG